MAELPRSAWNGATAELEPPFALVDLDALWANAADLERRAAPKPIRLASKSVRCRSLQERVLARDGFQGTLAFTLPEALWLARHGFEDILVAYPTADRTALRRADRSSPAERPRARVTVMVDSVEQLDLIDAARSAGEPTLGACSRVHRSRRRLSRPRRAHRDRRQALARAHPRAGRRARPRDPRPRGGAARRDHVLRGADRRSRRRAGCAGTGPRLRGAGDPRDPVAVRARAGRRAAPRGRRGGARARAPLELVNGGGTGSLERTAAEPAITEVTAGSGLYGPALFDSYRAFTPRPAALFALPVVRRPGPRRGDGARRRLSRLRTRRCRAPARAVSARRPAARPPGGGRRGADPAARRPPRDRLAVGDRVWLRHAKAGELCERFASLHLLERRAHRRGGADVSR